MAEQNILKLRKKTLNIINPDDLLLNKGGEILFFARIR